MRLGRGVAKEPDEGRVEAEESARGGRCRRLSPAGRARCARRGPRRFAKKASRAAEKVEKDRMEAERGRAVVVARIGATMCVDGGRGGGDWEGGRGGAAV